MEKETTAVTASDSAPAPLVLSELSPEQRAQWRTDGLPPKAEPVKESKEEKKESSSSEAEESATSTEKSVTAADSETATTQGKKPNAEERKAQLNQEIRDLIRKRDELKQTAAPRETKQEPQPAAEKTVEAKLAPKSAKPKIDDKDEKGEFKFKSLDEFNDARDEWNRQETVREFEEKAAKSAKETEAQQAERVVNQRFAERIEKSRETHDDFDTVALNPDLPIRKGSAIDLFLVDSEQGAEVLYHLGSNPQELERINALHPLAQVRELTKIELKLSEKPVPAPPVTKAPKPVSEVGGRGTSQENPALAAVRSGDYRGASSEWNRAAKEGRLR